MKLGDLSWSFFLYMWQMIEWDCRYTVGCFGIESFGVINYIGNLLTKNLQNPRQRLNTHKRKKNCLTDDFTPVIVYVEVVKFDSYLTLIIREGGILWKKLLWPHAAEGGGETEYLGSRFNTHTRQVPGTFKSCENFKITSVMYGCVCVFYCNIIINIIAYLHGVKYTQLMTDVLHKPTRSQMLLIRFCCRCSLNSRPKQHSAKKCYGQSH